MNFFLVELCKVLFIVITISGFITTTAGCHAAEHVRRKRQVSDPMETEVIDTGFLRDFFTTCLKNKVGEKWSWQSVVDVSILDSKWYLNSANDNCKEDTVEDSARCWKQRLSTLLKERSSLNQPGRECIDEYSLNTTGSLLPYDVSRGKRQAPSTSNSTDQCTAYYPNSPVVRRYVNCNNNTVMLTRGRANVDFPSVTQYVAQDVICASEFSDCGSNNMETITNNNRRIPRWPYRFEAITRTTSPVRSAVTICNNREFPLPTDNDSNCQQWGSWSICICGRGGTRYRVRTCPASFTGNTRQTVRCSGNTCSRSFVDLLRQILILNQYKNLGKR